MAQTFLGIVLARGGSKGIPKKNIKPLKGLPLLAYTIIEAKKSRYLDKLVLSTDDEEIIKVGLEYGADVPFVRPKELALDSTPSVDVIIHALEWLRNNQNYQPDFIVLLQPTSPLRKAEDIDGAIEKVLRENGDSLVSLYKAEHNPYWSKQIIDNRVVPFLDEGVSFTRRQDLPEIYNLNGAIYIARAKLLEREKTFYVGKTLPYVMPRERSVDIDDMFDWKIAEFLIDKEEAPDGK